MRSSAVAATVGLMLAVVIGSSSPLLAHCDTLGGPVVGAARLALSKGDVTPVLKWVKPDDESEIRELFAKTLQVRSLGPAAQEMADTHFFETLVRVHRAGEGAPYTGLKAADEVDPAVALTDLGLESGSIDRLVTAMNAHVAEGIRERFARAVEARAHADESVAAGREYVEAYVQLTHYVERLHQDATAGGGHEHAAPAAAEHQH